MACCCNWTDERSAIPLQLIRDADEPPRLRFSLARRSEPTVVVTARWGAISPASVWGIGTGWQRTDRDPASPPRRNAWFGVSLLYGAVAVWAIAATVNSVISGSFEGLTNGRDSFGSTCGTSTGPDAGTIMADLSTTDASDRPYLYHFAPATAGSLSLCVAACPASDGVGADAAALGLCLNATSAARQLGPEAAARSGIDTTGEHAGCPGTVLASRPVLRRCAPLSQQHATDGLHIDLLASFWNQNILVVGLATLAAVVVASLLCLCCHPVLNPKGLWLTAVALAVITTLRLAISEQALAGPGIAPTPLGQQVADTDGWVYAGAVAVLAGVAVFGSAAMWPLFGRRLLRARPFLHAWAGMFRRRLGLLRWPLYFIGGYFGLAAFLAFGCLSAAGGCKYVPDEVDGVFNGGSYACESALVASMPWAAVALLGWTYYLLAATWRAIVSRSMACDFLRHRHPTKNRAAVQPALQNTGQMGLDGLVALITTPCRWLVGLRVGRLNDIPGGIALLRRFKLASRLRAIEAGMDRSSGYRIDFSILKTLQSKRHFADSATVVGDFVVGSLTAIIGCLVGNAVDIQLQGQGSVRYSAVVSVVFALVSGIVANSVLTAIQTGVDTLALLCIVEANCAGSTADLPFVLVDLFQNAAQNDAGLSRPTSSIEGLEMDDSEMGTPFGGLGDDVSEGRGSSGISPPVSFPPATVQVPAYDRHRAAVEEDADPVYAPSAPPMPPDHSWEGNSVGGGSTPASSATDIFSFPAAPELPSGADYRALAEFVQPVVTAPGRLAPAPPVLHLDPPPSGRKSEIDAGAADGREPQRRDSLLGICKVCLDADSDQVLFPCKHLCLCAACVHRIRVDADRDPPKCPVCRAPFMSVTNVFLQ